MTLSGASPGSLPAYLSSIAVARSLKALSMLVLALADVSKKGTPYSRAI